jgi:hypothetical protein
MLIGPNGVVLSTHPTGRESTVTVAASDSSPRSKAQADVVCKGVDDQIKIQEAIDALPAGGGKVVLSSGEFAISTAFTLPANVELCGFGLSSILKATADITVVNAPNGGCKIKDLKVTSDVVRTGGTGIYVGGMSNEIDGVYIDNQYQGIYAKDATILYITNSNIRDCSFVNISIDGGNDHYIQNVVIDNPNTVDTNLAGVRLFRTAAIWMTDVDIIRGGIGLLADPPTGEWVRNGFFKGVAIDSSRGRGAYLSIGNGGDIRALTFVDCWLSYNGTVGALIRGAKLIKLRDCKIYGNKQHGVHLDYNAPEHVTIEGCYVLSNGAELADTYDNIFANLGSDIIIRHNKIGVYDVVGTTTPRYGVNVSSGVGCDALDNEFFNLTNPVSFLGTGHVRRNKGHVTENSGTATFSGDAATTAFTIAHGLAAAPTVVNLEAKSADAVGDKYWTADATNITVTFAAAPAAGTDNVVIGWEAKVR